VSPSGKPRNRSAPNAEHSARALQRFRKSVAHDLSRMLLADLDQAEAWFAEAIEVARRAARERDPLIKAQRSPRLAAVRAAKKARAAGLSRFRQVDQLTGGAAASAFATCGRAVHHALGSDGPGGDIVVRLGV
jgi:hypothetical protein